MSLERMLEKYDSCRLECDGLTRVLHLLLDKQGIRHTVMGGGIHDEIDNDYFSPHFWIELGNGDIVDFRARMWLGDKDHIPHGIFDPDDFPNMTYDGRDETSSFDDLPNQIVLIMAMDSCRHFDPSDFE